jgi:hypothetical protein
MLVCDGRFSVLRRPGIQTKKIIDVETFSRIIFSHLKVQQLNCIIFKAKFFWNNITLGTIPKEINIENISP